MCAARSKINRDDEFLMTLYIPRGLNLRAQIKEIISGIDMQKLTQAVVDKLAMLREAKNYNSLKVEIWSRGRAPQILLDKLQSEDGVSDVIVPLFTSVCAFMESQPVRAGEDQHSDIEALVCITCRGSMSGGAEVEVSHEIYVNQVCRLPSEAKNKLLAMIEEAAKKRS